ncbi:hypothetical protein IF1G_03626 [Cordyceps javanica]|uniref:Uncharacterized protein n=1 Tax=Cordyceps javanica TaxID=43265 RepID=A0A545V846_9HYPO|nr:hypothetical protein IF1G_03626 [Cordyceps javanica]
MILNRQGDKGFWQYSRCPSGAAKVGLSRTWVRWRPYLQTFVNREEGSLYLVVGYTSLPKNTRRHGPPGLMLARFLSIEMTVARPLGIRDVSLQLYDRRLPTQT